MNYEVKQAGDWLYGILPPKELKKIVEHYGKIEPSSKVVLSFDITLFELETLRLGRVPESRNCFEITKEVSR